MSIRKDSLLTDSVPALITRMAIPSVIAEAINILYSIVDRIYIGHIPGATEAALTGVGVTFPIITLITAFSRFAGSGGAPLSAIYHGKGDTPQAERILGSSVAMLLFFAVFLMTVFYLFMEPMLYLFGASDVTISYGTAYLSVYLLGTVFVLLSLGLNSYIIAQGASRVGMCSVLLGAVMNLILDPLFIFVFHMGVRGAAWATVLSQLASCVWVVSFLLSRKAILQIRFRYIRPDFRIIRRIAALGISPFVMSSTSSLVEIILNKGMQVYGGDLYVGSLTIMQSMLQLLAAPITGFTQGIQPIVSQNFGAQKFNRVRSAYQVMIWGSALFSLTGTLIFMIFPGFFAGLFTNSRELIALCVKKIPLFFSGMLIFGFQKSIQPTFVALGQAKVSIFIAIFRKIILLIPAALLLPLIWGTDGVYLAEPLSDILSVIVAIILFSRNIGKILTPDMVSKI